MPEAQLIVSVRNTTEDDGDALFGLAKDFDTSFAAEKSAFETALTEIISDERSESERRRSRWQGCRVPPRL